MQGARARVTIRQQAPFHDQRLKGRCYSCGEPLDPDASTVEHVPARVFLDRPYPQNLATVESCFACNNESSADELYVACLLDVLLVGSVDPSHVERPTVRHALARRPRLATRLAAAITSPETAWRTGPTAESLRVVATKLARGHAMYDLADPQYGPPVMIRWFRLDEASIAEAESFSRWRDRSTTSRQLLPEVGSRALLRMFDSREATGARDWVAVQEDRYRYSYRADEGGPAIRFVLRGYLACEVVW